MVSSRLLPELGHLTRFERRRAEGQAAQRKRAHRATSALRQGHEAGRTHDREQDQHRGLLLSSAEQEQRRRQHADERGGPPGEQPIVQEHTRCESRGVSHEAP